MLNAYNDEHSTDDMDKVDYLSIYVMNLHISVNLFLLILKLNFRFDQQ